MPKERWEPLASKPARIAFWLFTAWAILYLSFQLLGMLQRIVAPMQGILVPLFVGFGIAYILDPLADRLERFMPRAAAVTVIALGAVAVLALFLAVVIPVFVQQASLLIASFPDYFARFRDQVVPWAEQLRERFPEIYSTVVARTSIFVRNIDWGSVLLPATQAAGTVLSKVGGFLTWVVGLAIIPVIAIYLLMDIDDIRATLADLVPLGWRDYVYGRGREIDRVLGSFVRGYTTVCSALALMYCVGLAALGVPLWLVIGLSAGLLNLIPYFGTTLGISMALILTVAEYGLEWWRVLAVLGVFAVAQFIEGWLLTPHLVGREVGLHPVIVILAVVLGGQLFGLAGMFLAVPAAAVVMVFAKDAVRRFKESDLYQERSETEDASPT